MKNFKNKLLTLIAIIGLQTGVAAQGDVPPLVDFNNLKKELVACEKKQRDLKTTLQEMEKIPEEVTLAAYNRAKEDLEGSKLCVDALLVELSIMAKDFPEWGKGNAIVPPAVVERNPGIFVINGDIFNTFKDFDGQFDSMVELNIDYDGGIRMIPEPKH